MQAHELAHALEEARASAKVIIEVDRGDGSPLRYLGLDKVTVDSNGDVMLTTRWEI